MIVRIAAAVLLFAGAAYAQQPDPRLAAPTIQVLQAQVAFLQASIRVSQEDLAAERLTIAPALNAYRWFANPLVHLQ